MAIEKFGSISEIPDLVPEELLKPFDREDLRVPRETEHVSHFTSPIEVGYILFTAGGFFHPYKNRLEFHAMQNEVAADFLDQSWMNHTGRAVVRAALDPDRYVPIDMFAVYQNEEGSARFPSANEHDFYKHFARTWGVLANRE
jgi:hypothetical protein